MIARRFFTAVCLIVFTLSAWIPVVQAERGTPDSPEFGYGGLINPGNALAVQAVMASADLHLDWISLDLDWAALWPDPNQPMNIQSIDNLLQIAHQYDVPVLISITDIPGWANSPEGPNPDLTAWLVVQLAQRYPDVLKSVELFPASNTIQGWGAPPNPIAYGKLILTVQNSLTQAGSPLLVVAGGFVPSYSDEPAGTMDDVLFLQEIYQAYPNLKLPVISIRFPDLTGDPTLAPNNLEHRTLRHYEEIRQVMVDNNREGDLLWITQFKAPSGKIDPQDRSYTTSVGQTNWLVSAYQQLKSQLYFGAVFYDSINPGGGDVTESSCLLKSNQSKQAFYPILKQLVEINRQNSLPNLQNPGVKYKQHQKTYNRPPF